MQLKLFRHLWGVELPWEKALPAIKSLGYTGIEALLPAPADDSRFLDLLAQNNLQFVAIAQTNGKTAREHVQSLQQQTLHARKLNARFVAAQGGTDSFDDSDIKTFYSESLKVESDSPIAIAHETHRGRPLFHPRVSAAILQQFPSLKLVCDFSHWVCVSERLLDDSDQVLHLAARQAYHVHARVGYAQGAQVPDPRVPKYQPELQAHQRWWDLIWDSQKQRGFKETTICPEFGPPPYLQTDPLSGQPAADLWEVVEWQSNQLQTRFNNRPT
jgi:sugar phosphate isomerase/epimerase